MSAQDFTPLPYQRRRRFRLWPWITLGIVVGVIALGAVIGVAVFSAFNSLKNTGPIPARY